MADDLLPVCILAGGLATRLGDQARTRPKALIEVAGEPFILHQLRLLRSHGASRVVLCVGHLGEQITEAVGDGSELGLAVSYSDEGPRPIGTAAAVRGALGSLGEAFFVLYGDTYLRIDYPDVQRAFQASSRPALLTVLRNEGRWDRSNTHYRDGEVIRHDKRSPTPDMEWIDYGLSILSPRAMEAAPSAADLSDVYGELAEAGLLAGYEAHARFYEIGSPESLREADEFLRGVR
jgi:NDP-sugar pyrophosphorylase family protein